MRGKIILISLFFIAISCGSKSQDKDKSAHNVTESGDVSVDNSADVAQHFLNQYIENMFHFESYADIVDWIESNDYVTADFKNEYTHLVNKAYEKDPQMGLVFDPIIDAQDFPSEGFEVESYDSITKLVVLKWKNWEEFKVHAKIKQINEVWKFDGCGVINMQEEERAIR